jgi:hypothetical protein
MRRLLSGALGWISAALSLAALWGCGGDASASVTNDRVLVRVLGTQFRVVWFFHAVGAVPAIIATAAPTDGSQPLHSDSLPPSAVVDSATFNLPAPGVILNGTACSRSSTQPAASASCKPWTITGPGTVTDSTIIKLVLLPHSVTVIALVSSTQVPGDSNRCQFCAYAQTADSIFHPVTNNAGVAKCDSLLKTFPKWSLAVTRVPKRDAPRLWTLASNAVDITVLEPNTHRVLIAGGNHVGAIARAL